MKVNRASLSTLQALLSPPQKPNESSARSMCGIKSLLSWLGMLFGGEDEFVVASVLHDQPSRYHRTHVEEEASLSGVLLIQVHSVVKTDLAKGSMEVFRSSQS